MWHSRVNFYLFIFLLSSKILKYSTKNKSISKIKYFDLTVSYETLSYCTPTATNRNSKITAVASRLVASVLGKVFFFFASVFWVRVSIYMFIIPMVFYLFTGFAWYSVNLEINYDTRKIVQTLQIKKNNNKKK